MVVNMIFSLLYRGLIVLLLIYFLKFFRNGYIARRRVKSLAAQGIVSNSSYVPSYTTIVSSLPEMTPPSLCIQTINKTQPIATYSLFFGHLGIFGDFRQAHPPDVNIHVFHTWLAKTYQKYFPGLEKIPPVVYLDLWPLGPSFALVYDATAIPQFTQAKVLPKFNGSVDFMEPLTSNLDIVTTEGALWKTWRSRFNPGFGSRNIIALLPELIEEVSVFAGVLKSLAGNDYGWGPVFQLKEKASNLTFDIICRMTL